MVAIPAIILSLFRSSFAKELFSFVNVSPWIRSTATGRFVSYSNAARSTAMSKYWARIRKLGEIYPENSISDIRGMWKDEEIDEEDLYTRGYDWDDVYGVSPY